MREQLTEDLLSAWIGLTGILKNNRITKAISYNEAIVLWLAYRAYRADGVGKVAIGAIVKETGMLKSIVNRTVEVLLQKGYLIRERGEDDRRTVTVRFVGEKVEEFLSVHRDSVSLAERIIEVIGEEDAEAFIGIYRKIRAAGITLRDGNRQIICKGVSINE